MVGRQWSFAIEDSRAAEFRSFAREVALPMVRGRMGCAGVVILREADSSRYTLISLWVSRKAMDVAFSSREWERVVEGLGKFGVDVRHEDSAQFEGIAFFLAGEKPDAPSEPHPPSA